MDVSEDGIVIVVKEWQSANEEEPIDVMERKFTDVRDEQFEKAVDPMDVTEPKSMDVKPV